MSILTSTYVGKTAQTVYFQNLEEFIVKILWDIAHHSPGYYSNKYIFDIKNTKTGAMSKKVFTIDSQLTVGLTDALSMYLYSGDVYAKNHFVTEMEDEIKNNIIGTLKNYFQTYKWFPCDCMVKDSAWLWLSEKNEKHDRTKQSNYLVLI